MKYSVARALACVLLLFRTAESLLLFVGAGLVYPDEGRAARRDSPSRSGVAFAQFCLCCVLGLYFFVGTVRFYRPVSSPGI